MSRATLPSGSFREDGALFLELPVERCALRTSMDPTGSLPELIFLSELVLDPGSEGLLPDLLRPSPSSLLRRDPSLVEESSSGSRPPPKCWLVAMLGSALASRPGDSLLRECFFFRRPLRPLLLFWPTLPVVPNTKDFLRSSPSISSSSSELTSSTATRLVLFAPVREPPLLPLLLLLFPVSSIRAATLLSRSAASSDDEYVVCDAPPIDTLHDRRSATRRSLAAARYCSEPRRAAPRASPHLSSRRNPISNASANPSHDPKYSVPLALPGPPPPELVRIAAFTLCTARLATLATAHPTSTARGLTTLLPEVRRREPILEFIARGSIFFRAWSVPTARTTRSWRSPPTRAPARALRQYRVERRIVP
mmetsp:Transcript_38903/g.93579  ORF Transcript_38903/g.93579 Transcript_38903/m.93579 type:complete len:366 (-) Transcript_38903:72-1169(-)